jgi:arylsulfatase A-like enzyme
MSLFTGLYPVNHGMRSGLEARRPEARPAAALLRAGGYHTAAFTENGFIIRALGFAEGFSEYTENPGDRSTAPGDARKTFGQAERWLEANRRQPFFLFVHTYQVHAPFGPVPETVSLFREDGEPGTASAALRREHDDYDREIRYVDSRLRELVATLERLGLRDSTTLVVLSDHGEEFGEHGAFQHGTALFEETLRVPLVFAGRGIPAGLRIREQVSLIDVLPTLLELASVPAPARLDGRSLLPAMRGETLPERTLFAEATAPYRWLRPGEREDWNPPLIAARSQHSKLLVHRPETGATRPALRFDLEADTLERSPETLENGDLAAAQRLVDDYLRGHPGEAQPAAEQPALDPGLEERLESLGYLVD